MASVVLPLLMLCLTALGISLSARAPAAHAAMETDASSTFFDGIAVTDLKIEIPEPELEKLKADNRSYVRCTVRENHDAEYPNIAIKLKGAAGSFRELDDRPALTLNTRKFNKGQKFHGLEKFHLNNSVQDETYLQEWLCEELLRAAGVPATRVTHARVWLNDRDLGLYVLKEGFDKTFLQRHFEDANGNLYDGGFVQDIDAELEKDAGNGPDDRSDLAGLLAACQAQDPEERRKRVAELLDVDRFLTFMAMELMTCHWDGYTASRNNYRIYINPTDHRAHFLPHGMDQMFGDASASILEPPPSIVASTVMHDPEWRAKYRERIGDLLPLFSPPEKLLTRVDVIHRRLRPVIAAMDLQLAVAHDERVRELKERLVARAASLTEQHGQPDPQHRDFDEQGNLYIADWNAVSESDDALHESTEAPVEKPAYSITCGESGHCIASWRRKVLLSKGTYSFHASAQTADVVAIVDEKGAAAGLRISGAQRTDTLDGTTSWTALEFEFTIEEDVREVELVAELRATRGQVWFEAESLRLSRKTELGE